jgi:hypothetical protein
MSIIKDERMSTAVPMAIVIRLAFLLLSLLANSGIDAIVEYRANAAAMKAKVGFRKKVRIAANPTSITGQTDLMIL